jgi:ferredoxin
MSQEHTELPSTSSDGRARAHALALEPTKDFTPTSLVNYRSSGRLLLRGTESDCLEAARTLREDLTCTVWIPSDKAPVASLEHGLRTVRGGNPALQGALGHFTLSVNQEENEIPLDAVLLEHDLVLDLASPPMIEAELLPVGYYSPTSPEALERDLKVLPGMTGEFEKPKYFNYNPSLCAHGRSGLPGCTRCLEACPANAITSLGDGVSVDPYLCQGGGSCVAACPTGAMTYAFPRVSDLLNHVKSLLGDYEASGGKDPVLLFHDAWSGQTIYGPLAGALSERVLPVQLEEIGSVGMDTWMSCLAYGAAGVIMAVTGGTPSRMSREIGEQIEFALPILTGMGYPQGCLAMVNVDASDSAAAMTDELPRSQLKRAARFQPQEDKRTNLRNAINHLHSQTGSSRKSVDLPAAAPFGEIRVDQQACTLCMGCVAVCPTSALRDGGDLPQLKFLEWDCVQCGLCETACPETAITRHARFIYDNEARHQVRTLNEEKPFCCIVCGKAFATQSMLKVVSEKLEGHWMWQTEKAKRRLYMCDICRAKDMMQSQLSNEDSAI